MAKEPKGSESNKPSSTVAIELITPEIANQWLESGQLNRQISKGVVLRYKEAIEDKRWIFTGESISLDGGEPGKEFLLNGWHRCNAIVQSGIPVWCVVVRNVPREAFHVMDHGRNRTFRDTLFVLHRPYPEIVAPASSYLTGYVKYKRFTTHQMEDFERWETFQKHPELETYAENYSKRLPLRGVPAGLLTAMQVILSGISSDVASEFLELIVQGDDLETDHPVTQFRHYVKKQESLDVRPTNQTSRYGYGLLHSWNLYRKDERVSKWRCPALAPEPV